MENNTEWMSEVVLQKVKIRMITKELHQQGLKGDVEDKTPLHRLVLGEEQEVT